MKKRLLFCSLFFLLQNFIYAQEPRDPMMRDFFCATSWVKNPKGKFYIAFGYNKEWYTKSDIHVHDDETNTMNFTLYDMKAHDKPHFNELFKVPISIPQYGYRMGYWLPNNHWGIEINFDHAKYIAYDNQRVKIDGHIYGQPVSGDTLVTYSFLHLEHTDGANFLMLNLMYRKNLIEKKFISAAWIAKLGGGMVVPRSDVTLLGNRWNHCFHVAGQVFGIETGFRTEFFRFFFLETTVKAVYANFANVLAFNPVLISHRFGAFMVEAHLGFQLPVGKAKNWAIFN
jgi:hypothetical protein